MEFSFRSGRLCLDFAATLMFRAADAPLELLTGPPALAAWAEAAGAVNRVDRQDLSEPDHATREPAGGEHAGAGRSGVDLAAAIGLREACYELGCALARGDRLPPGAVDVVNDAARVPPPTPTLRPSGRVRSAGTLAAVRSAVARDMIDLVGGDLASRVRQCHRDGCTRLFVDRSRGGNRIWCGMRECGNRVNAAAYRRRREAGDQATGDDSTVIPVG